LIFGIIFVGFYIILRNIIMPNINIEFYFPLILGIVIHLFVIRRLNLISDSLVPKVEELRNVVLSTVLIIVLFSSIFAIKYGLKPFLIFNLNIVWVVFSEELIFRSYMLGLAFIGIHITFKDRFLIHLPDNNKELTTSILTIFVLGLLFSDLHVDWVGDPLRLLIRLHSGFTYGLAFLVTNKKIYAPCFLHYINNVCASI